MEQKGGDAFKVAVSLNRGPHSRDPKVRDTQDLKGMKGSFLGIVHGVF